MDIVFVMCDVQHLLGAIRELKSSLSVYICDIPVSFVSLFIKFASNFITKADKF